MSERFASTKRREPNRVIYIAKLAEAVFVLHCFKKATQKTSPKDIAVAKGRYETLIRDMTR